MPDWILYGASGYTAELIARDAAQRGLHPILAGRDEAAIPNLAAEHGCPSREVPLSGISGIGPNPARTPVAARRRWLWQASQKGVRHGLSATWSECRWLGRREKSRSPKARSPPSPFPGGTWQLPPIRPELATSRFTPRCRRHNFVCCDGS